ncbi:EAL domain-containing protein [Demequina iriomotensis]|uniref:EAL domain-containing protein n=1 Tax=Demequina iriomotensis TaxID=1536641 RepID=UPI000780237D|nr:EAL domain-containing protein [Demequina iriomotensis]
MNHQVRPRLWHPPHLVADATRVLVARQGIFTRDGEAHGHELLYRAEGHGGLAIDRWSAADQDRATEHVLAATFWRDPDITSPLPAFVNFTGSYLLTREVERDCDARRVVVEIVESTDATEAVVDRVAALKRRGFRIALDDFIGTASQQRLLPLADYVKIDWRDLVMLGPGLVGAARAHGALLVAERVEDQEILDDCARLGFDLYQGWRFEPAVTLDRGACDEQAAVA